ncbi:MAG: type I-D CRISPR-associated endonuclease Cas1 [bacterium]|nr:type I-D CRISPR-associated endonuclease Cas1 [bacterium]
MATIYVTEQGAVLRKIGERLKVMLRSEVLIDIPLIKVSHVVIFGKASVTAAAVQTLLEKEIEICYLTQRGRFVGRLVPAASKNVLLRQAQYRASFDDKKSLALAKRFVAGKLANMRAMLLRAARDTEDFDPEHVPDRIKTAITRSRKAKNVDRLRGHEGDGSAAYFSLFGKLLKQEDFRFDTRKRRPPTDPVNALLSFGYTLLMNEIYSAVNIVGFDPYIGYLHADRYGRPSLALDLMEEFRPIFIDSLVLNCINKQILKSDDFREEMGKVTLLTEDGLQKFLEQYERRKRQDFAHPVLKQQTSYARCFEQQARFLAKTLQGELKDYPPLVVK